MGLNFNYLDLDFFFLTLSKTSFFYFQAYWGGLTQLVAHSQPPQKALGLVVGDLIVAGTDTCSTILGLPMKVLGAFEGLVVGGFIKAGLGGVSVNAGLGVGLLPSILGRSDPTARP